MVATLRNRRLLYHALLTACLAWANLAQADQPPAPGCSLSLCAKGQSPSDCHGESQGLSGIGNCGSLISIYRNALPGPSFDNFVNCASGASFTFDADHGHSVLDSCGCGCVNNAPEFEPEDDPPDCESVGLVTGGGGCTAPPDEPPDPDAPTDEECQEGSGGGAPVVLRSSGGSAEEAGATYIDADFGGSVNQGGCNYTSTGSAGGGGTAGSPNSGDTAIGPDYDTETPGVQNCFSDSVNGVTTYYCDNYYESGGTSDGSPEPENLTRPGVNDREGTKTDSVDNNDDTETEITTTRDFEQISPDISQERIVRTETDTGPNGEVIETRETETTTLRYSDGSTTQTRRTTTSDGDGNPVSVTISGESTAGATGPDDSEEEGEGSASGIDNCSVSPLCEADPVQCELLLGQWYEICGFENSVPDAIILADSVDGSALIEEDFDVESTVNDLLNNTGFLGSRSCPTNSSVNTSIGGSLTFSWVPVCDLAGAVSFLLLTFAGFRSARILLSGI